VDRNKLVLLQHHWTVGKERRFDRVKDLALEPGITEIGCDKNSIFCTAAVEVLPGPLAVWTVWSDEKTGHLVSRGLGKGEIRLWPKPSDLVRHCDGEES